MSIRRSSITALFLIMLFPLPGLAADALFIIDWPITALPIEDQEIGWAVKSVENNQAQVQITSDPAILDVLKTRPGFTFVEDMPEESEE